MSVLVVGDNGGDGGLDAVALGSTLAELLGSDVLRARVVGAGDPEPSEDPSAGRIEVIRARSAARALYEFAESQEAGMVVLGSSHRAGTGRILLGRVAHRLLQGGPCPIAVAPAGYGRGEASEPRVIGVAFDASPESNRALALAAELAKAAGAALRVITAYPGMAPPEEVMPGAASVYEQMRDAPREAVRPLPASLRAEPRFRIGEPADVLIAESELGIDLLVMGSRGYGPLRSVFLGGVSEEVMRRAACPVIVVPRGATPNPAPGEPGARGA